MKGLWAVGIIVLWPESGRLLRSPRHRKGAKTGILCHPYPGQDRFGWQLAPEPRSPSVFWSRKVRAQGTSHYLVHAPGVSSPSTSCPSGASADKVPTPSRGNKQQNSGSAIIPSSSRLSRAQVDYEREQQREQDMGFTEAAREGHVEEYCRTILGLQWDVGVGVWGGGMWKEHPDYGRLYPPCPESRQVPGWKKAGNLVPYLVLKRAGPALKGMCLPPCLDTINQNRPLCLQSGWSTALYPPTLFLNASEKQRPQTWARSPV